MKSSKGQTVKKHFSLWGVFFILLAFVLTVLLRDDVKTSQQGRILPPPEGTENFAFGFNEVISDLLWLNFIQYSWVCQQDGRCYKDWGYRVLDEATMLSPEFRSLYIHGALGVSILLDDDYGAKTLFDRGLLQYPEDWRLNYNAGYHYLLELDRPDRAAQLFEKASLHGAPFWTRSLSAKLYSRTGQLETSEKILTELIDQAVSSEWKDSLEERLKEVRQKKRSISNN